MILRKFSKNWLVRVIFGCFFGMIMLGGLTGVMSSNVAYAVPGETVAAEIETAEEDGASTAADDEEDAAEEETSVTDTTAATAQRSSGQTCEKSLGSLGWLICPTTGKLAEAVDALYGQIEEVLQINPVEVKDGSPIYEIWKYMRGLTNIVFIIFLLVVIWSQITGVGISNYGIKRALPKLIVAAVLMNLSYIICSLGVDLSNVVGSSLGGIFNSIAEATSGSVSVGMDATSVAEMYSALASGTALAVAGGVIAFELGAIWMLIPVVLGAIVAVVSGLITISLRQAVVALLVMIAPLAIVAYMLPNTEQLFKRWQQLLIKMLTFYPMFSVLFWASKFAGWGIMASAQSGFGLLLGVAVQIFPLFFSWSLMKMSGTFLGAVNMRLRGLAMPMLGANRRWADSMRMHSHMKHLAAENAYTPSLKLMQVLSDMRTKRDFTTKQYMETVRLRGMAYHAQSHYKWRDGHEVDVTAFGEEQMELGARNAEYQEVLDRNKNHINKGVSGVATIAANSRKLDRIQALDTRGMDAADALVAEKSRGMKIDIDNAKSRYERFEAAMNAHEDARVNGYTINADGTVDDSRARADYKRHFDLSKDDQRQSFLDSMDRYGMLSDVMEGDVIGAHFVAASAASDYDTQHKILAARMQKYAELNPPTKDVVHRLKEFSKSGRAVENIDSIIAMLRVVNQRGDTDIVKDILDDVVDEGVQLGTHASQSIANFLMFDVGNNDPYLRREGKYINLETAQVYNSNKRQEMRLDPNEYIKGYYLKRDENGVQLPDVPENRVYTKRSAAVLLQGTSFDNIERTAMGNITDSLMKAYGYTGVDGEDWDVQGYLAKEKELRTAIGPQFISASLKYLSGSEQMGSAVKFLTGFDKRIKRESYVDAATGETRWRDVVDGEGKPVYETVQVWNDPRFGRHKDEVQKFYRDQVKGWISDQTASQILNMRSDYRDAVAEHLLDSYFHDEDSEDAYADGDERESLAQHRRKYDALVSEIQNRDYSRDENGHERTPEEAQRLRAKDLREAKLEFAGKELRRITGLSGSFDRMNKMINSSASSATKGWMSDMLLFGDDTRRRQEVEYYKRKRKELHDARYADSGGSGGSAGGIYNEAFINGTALPAFNHFVNDHDSDSIEDFHDGLISTLRGLIGENSFIERDFEKTYCEDLSSFSSNRQLYEILEREYLSKVDMYPG